MRKEMQPVLTGIDRIREGEWKRLTGYRLGLLSNQASLDSNLDTSRDVISSLLPGQLKVLFGPQHGYGGEDQDNMVETEHTYDKKLNIPILSLYADTREPLPEMLEGMDMLIIDLMDVGTRVYTFASTMLNCLKAAAGQGKKVLVLDRPNPLGGEIVEGNLLRPDLYSFVGPYSLPMRHGLTMAEMASVFNHVFGLNCDLQIISMEGWRREMLWHKTGLRWIMPSPNMPFPETASVYPGQVIWEGTNLSEGRGTCRPFEIFGAPYLDTRKVKRALDPEGTSGCCLQDYQFRPTFHKWRGELCNGFMIHIIDFDSYRPYLTTIALLKAVMETHPQDFEWKPPPYEYEYEKKPVDLIVGDSSIRQDLEKGASLSAMREKWEKDLASFVGWRTPYLLYQ
jgi:uncharacterized protein YbbC (DUF1343 family)